MVDFDNITRGLKDAMDALIEWQALPVRYEKTRNGWAAYKGRTRITKFKFTEGAAREAAIDWEASDVKTQF